MQQPTLKNTRVRSVADVHKICYAAYLGRLPIITRRLDTHERSALAPGDVYVWEERNSLADISGLGIVRWTEGKKWTPSRVVGDFLYYYEKVAEGIDPGDILARQTYSTTLNAPEPRGPFKICFCTYHSKNTADSLRTIDEVPDLKDLVVPEGIFHRQRRSSRKVGETYDDPDAPSPMARRRSSESKRRHSVSHTYAPYPARSPSLHLYALQRNEDATRVATTSSALTDNGGTVLYHPYQPIRVAPNIFGSSASLPALAHADPDNSPSRENYTAVAAASVSSLYRPSLHHPEVTFPSFGQYAQPNFGADVGSAYASQVMTNDFSISETPPRRANSLPSDQQPRCTWPSMSPEGSPILWTGAGYGLQSRSHSSNGSRSSSRLSGQSEHAVSLAPLSTLREAPMYRRDPADDRLLRLISSENVGATPNPRA